ncbi:hypothetical protein NDU88_007617 [Pleurodeles waltl]|uniref:Uncharacterized protein n=1 Tax=Pleurodeles waltl TaxID=8319 RepID=A0AAV7RPZ7_PLEWA|nr:hypothetical protein NDU88_007617 [Pleurodeles waltl]
MVSSCRGRLRSAGMQREVEACGSGDYVTHREPQCVRHEDKDFLLQSEADSLGVGGGTYSSGTRFGRGLHLGCLFMVLLKKKYKKDSTVIVSRISNLWRAPPDLVMSGSVNVPAALNSALCLFGHYKGQCAGTSR